MFLLLVQLALLVAVARIGAEISKRLGLPAVVGELSAGIALGPTLLGHYFPNAFAPIFPPDKSQFHLLDAFGTVGMSLLLLLTGLETDLRLLRNLGRAALIASVMGMVLPFGLGFGLGYVMPAEYLADPNSRILFSLFLATAMSISAMPVIAKILIDLDLTKRNIGLVILSAGVVDDTVGWLILSLIAARRDPRRRSTSQDLGLTVALPGDLHRWSRSSSCYPILRVAVRVATEHFKTSDSDLVLVIVTTFLCAAATERIGVHPVFGAFVAGIVLHQVPRLRKETIARLESVTYGVLAPIFFGIVGLRVDLWALGGGSMLGIVLARRLRRQAGRLLARRLLGRAAVLGGGVDRGGDERARRDGDRRRDDRPVAGDPDAADVLDHRHGRDRDVVPRARRPAADDAARAHDRRRGAAHPRVGIDGRLRSGARARRCWRPAAGPTRVAAAPLAFGLAYKSSAAVKIVHVVERRPGGGGCCTVRRHVSGQRHRAGRADARARRRRRPPEVVQVERRQHRARDLQRSAPRLRHHLIGSGEGPVDWRRGRRTGGGRSAVPRGDHEGAAARERLQAHPGPRRRQRGSRLAVELALRYAEATNAELALAVLTERRPQAAAYADLSGTHVAAEVRATSDEELQRISIGVPRLRRQARHLHLAFDPRSSAVADEVENGNYDLVVLGAENRAIQHRLFFGYENERLIRGTRIPVVVVVPNLSRLGAAYGGS